MRTCLGLERDDSVFRQMASALGCDDGDEPVGAMLTRLAGIDQHLQAEVAVGHTLLKREE